MKTYLNRKSKPGFPRICLMLLLSCPGVFQAVLPFSVAFAQSQPAVESAIDNSFNAEQPVKENSADINDSAKQQDWQDLLVQDVLEQDIRQALRGYSEKNPVNSQSVKSILAPRLVALYGVGKALMAEVQVGNQAYLYIRGQTYPAGHLGDKRVYQLKAMNGACVQLEKEQDRHSLCLRMLLGESLS